MADIADTARPPKTHANLRVNVQRLYLFATIILFRFLMDFTYGAYLSPENEIENHFFNYLNTEKLYESWGLMLACAVFLPHEIRKPSDYLLLVLFIFPCVSMFSLFAYLDGDPVYAYSTAAAFIIVATARNINCHLPFIQIRDGHRISPPLIGILVITVAIVYMKVVGGSMFQLNIMDVYSVRLDVTEAISRSNFLGYVGTWTWTLFTGFLMAWSLLHRRWILLALLLGLQVYFFGMTSAKIVLFFPGMVFLTYALVAFKRPATWLFYGVILLVMIGIAEELVSDTYLWNHVLVRRILWDPGRTNWLYHDLFSRIGHVYMSENVLKYVIPYPFQLDPPHLIGLETYGRADANADTGFLGTAYMHFGVFGMVLFSLIAGLLLRLTDMLTLERMPVWMGAAITIGPFYALYNDSDLTTTLATHALGPALALLFLYGRLRPNLFVWRSKRTSAIIENGSHPQLLTQTTNPSP